VVKRRRLSVGAAVVCGCLAVGGAFYLHEKGDPAVDTSSLAQPARSVTPTQVKDTAGVSPFDDAAVGPLLTQELTPSDDSLHRAIEPQHHRPPHWRHHEPPNPELPLPPVNGAVPTLPDPPGTPSVRPGPLPEEPPLGGAGTEAEPP
jgi:hypothetical protein